MSPFSWHFRGSLIAIIHGAWHLQVPMVWVHLTYPNSPPFPQMTPFTPACSPNCSQGLPTVPFIDTLCCKRPPLWDSAYTVSFFPWHMKTTEVQPSKQTDSASPLSSSPARLLILPPRGSRPRPGTQCVLMRESPNGRDTCVKALPCPSELASRSRRRSACRSWDWGYIALHTAAWEAWGQPVDREQAMSGFALSAAITRQQRSSPGQGVPSGE